MTEQTTIKKTQEMEKKKNNIFICNLIRYLADRKFILIWCFFLLCLLFSSFGLSSKHWAWGICRIGLIILVGGVIILLYHKPLNVVYGLIGTKGNIRTYLSLLVVINIIFSIIYQVGFFKNAGITYDINQPYISYGMFSGIKQNTTTKQIPDKMVKVYSTDGVQLSYFIQSGDSLHFQRIHGMDVFKNTLMTSLMQEPSDLFAIASIYNEGADDSIKGPYDRQKSQLFHTLLILQIFISWIFFGVFISILYNKFRYES